mmetsp:Transcript_6815/g.21850  ORF Transcript_6815/g.21850 Transcript_6815/m.21850 type:complete len:170 (+) Transcript_6815:274-783(+)
MATHKAVSVSRHASDAELAAVIRGWASPDSASDALSMVMDATSGAAASIGGALGGLASVPAAGPPPSSNDASAGSCVVSCTVRAPSGSAAVGAEPASALDAEACAGAHRGSRRTRATVEETAVKSGKDVCFAFWNFRRRAESLSRESLCTSAGVPPRMRSRSFLRRMMK